MGGRYLLGLPVAMRSQKMTMDAGGVDKDLDGGEA